jgi:Sec-independent protein translocase protein TatA
MLLLGLVVLGPKRLHAMLGHVARAKAELEKATRGLKSQLGAELDAAHHQGKTETSLSTDAMEGTGNLMAVMDAIGHEKVDTTRLYNHPGTKQIRDAIERRNQLVQ